jgi:4-hydroxyphenylpyruvate dioxygenase
MARSEALGILKLEDVVFYVHEIERSTRFYVDTLDFALTARSSAALEDGTRETTRVFEAGDIRVTVVAPKTDGSEAGRYLKRHPDGIGTLVFTVADVAKTFAVLDARGATACNDVTWELAATGTGRLGWFEITTPFGEGRFRFVERQGWTGPNPGFDAVPGTRAANRFGFERYDHVTSNFLTLRPMVLWCQDVLGLEPYWDIEFHTDDVATQAGDHGSGLKSVVLWDPHSGVKFANNEPKRPHFAASQIYTFVMDNHGPGFQHAALTTPDIQACVRGLREHGVRFMPTPASYYDLLPKRMQALGVGTIDEDIATLRDLQILVDGKGPGAYLLQIFLQEAAGLYGEAEAGPFFFEIIQRKGDRGFGGGNFRALFESIELEQKTRNAAGDPR